VTPGSTGGPRSGPSPARGRAGACVDTESRWRSVFENASAGVVLLDPAGHFFSANATYQAMVGYSEEELRKLTPADITHDEDRALTERHLAWLTHPYPPQLSYEKRLRRKDGAVIWAHICASVVPGRDGAPSLFAAVAVDITERKRAEQALREARAELARVTRIMTLGELAASIAHEINQPLSAIVTDAGASMRWLRNEPPNVPQAMEGLEAIAAAGAKAGEIIVGVRQLIRKSPPRMERVDVNREIQEVIALTRTEIQDHRVSLETRLAPRLPELLADRVQVQQVILNLIMNALESMLSCDGPRELSIESSAAEPGPITVQVKDTGKGLDPAAIEHVFDAFYTTKSDGMGMGLAISRSIVEAHGGKLWAAANSPRGAVFGFSLPVDDG
jgi:PAS domain S-box-containing protein